MLKKASRYVLASIKIHASLFYKIRGAHRLAPVRKRDAHYSSRRGPCRKAFLNILNI
jgi:hypothetical protein